MWEGVLITVLMQRTLEMGGWCKGGDNSGYKAVIATVKVDRVSLEPTASVCV